VREALRNVLRDAGASAAAKASAGRTLLEYFSDDKDRHERPVDGMNERQIDEEIAEIERTINAPVNVEPSKG
jgi:hypothetical protein